jgi:hypothetical protein
MPRGRGVYLLAAALLAGACAVGEKRDVTITRSWPAAGIKAVQLNGVDGSLNVRAGNTDQVQLIAHVRARGFQSTKNKPNEGFFEDRLEGGTLSIGQKKQRVHVVIPFFHLDQLQINYDLTVPPAMALDLNTINGRIATQGISGDAEMTTVNGTIDVEALGNSEISAKAVNGRIRAKFVNSFSGARLKTVNGGVEAILPQTASFTCNLSQVNGDFEASFPLSIHSHPGSRRVSGEVNGGKFQLQITTVNGDVEVQHMPVPPVPPPPATPVVPQT